MKKEKRNKNTGDWAEFHLGKLKNRKYAKAYLEIALEDYYEEGNREEFLMAIKDIVEAQGGMTYVSTETNLSRPSLYRALSGKGNPRLSTLRLVLKTLGFRLSIKPIHEVRS